MCLLLKETSQSYPAVNSVSCSNDQCGMIVYGYNSGTIIVGATKKFMVRFNVHTIGGNACLIL